MTDPQYRITFVIEQRTECGEDFADVGYGSSGAWSTIDAALHDLGSIVQNGEWETDPGMPDPGVILTRIWRDGVREVPGV